MTDKRTVAYILKEYHGKYGTDIMGYLSRTNQSEDNNRRNEVSPERASEFVIVSSNPSRLLTL